MKVALYKVHKWVGLGLGVLLLLQATTGLMMAHKEALAAWFGSEGLVDVSAEHQPLDQIIAAVHDAKPGYRFDRIIYRDNPALPLVARINPPDGGKFHVALIDPVKAQVLSSGPMWQYPLQLAERVHVALLSGTIGHYILLIEAIGLMFMGISGLIVWWPRKNRFRKALVIHWKSSPLRVIRDIHVVPGALTAVLMLFAGLTGAMLIADDALKAAVSTVAPLKAPIKLDFPVVDQPDEMISWQQAKDRLFEQFPDGHLRQLRFWGRDGRILATVMVAQNALNPRAHHIAAVDRWLDETTIYADGNQLPSGSAFIEWVLPLHTGEAWGGLRPVMMSILGLSLAGMCITGFWMWLKKRRPKRRQSAVTNRPVPDSGPG